MNLNRYQTEAARTIAAQDTRDMLAHGTLGLVSELSELTEAMDKIRGLHTADDVTHAVRELGDVAWMMAEIYTAIGEPMGQWLQDVKPNHNSDAATSVEWLCGHVQKQYQMHVINSVAVALEMRNVWARMLYMCACLQTPMPDVLDANIAKLRARYPDGFDARRSMHRQEGDD